MAIDSEIKQPYKKTEIKKAFDFTLKTITNISAPFLLLIILKDLHETVAYMKDNFLIALTFLIVFTFLFIWNVIILSRQTKIKSQKSEKDKSLFSIFPGIILRKLNILPRFNFRKFMLIVGIIISVGSLILFGVLVHLVNSTDAHYVVIASEPNEKKAVDRIQDLDEIKQLGEGMIEEKLCKKGQAYRRKRLAAGEKSSAYLNGRAVKVCKGQMKG